MSMDLRGLHPVVRRVAEEALRYAEANGFRPTITSTKRDWATQVRLRANYERCLATGQYKQTRECMWPANRPGDSAHQFGLAFDSVVTPDRQELWNLIRGRLGFQVPSHDQIHAEVPNWREIRPILQRQGITGR